MTAKRVASAHKAESLQPGPYEGRMIVKHFRERDGFSPGCPEVTLVLQIDAERLIRLMAPTACRSKARVATKAGGAIRVQAMRPDPEAPRS